MTTREVVVGHRLGLHARASAKLVRLSAQFRSDISLFRADQDEGKAADARSILAVLLLAAGYGVRLTVRADGEDEQAATEAICRFLEG